MHSGLAHSSNIVWLLRNLYNFASIYDKGINEGNLEFRNHETNQWVDLAAAASMGGLVRSLHNIQNGRFLIFHKVNGASSGLKGLLSLNIQENPVTGKGDLHLFGYANITNNLSIGGI